MNEICYMDDLEQDVEIIYSEEELEGIYRDYQERVYRKYELKKIFKKAFRL